MPPPFVDCHACACLIDAGESACPFCGAAQRRTDLSSLLALGLVLGLAAASCTDKPGPTSQSSSTTAQTTGTTGTDAGSETDGDSTVAPTSAYAGPPDSSSTDSTGSTGSTGTGTSSGETFDDTATASSIAYAAPPEQNQKFEPAPGK